MISKIKDIHGKEHIIDYNNFRSCFINCDCMEALRKMPDKCVDLSICDPPYGGVTKGGYMRNNVTGGVAKNRNNYHLSLWGCDKPTKEYFDELRRVSKNQIIWGGNYFASMLPDSQCWVVWDKNKPEGVGFADCELAWTSFDQAAKMFRFTWNGMLQGDMKHKEKKIHPCLPEGEQVFFNNQWKSIENVKIGDENIFGKVSDITTHEAEKIIEICTLENNKTLATWNHPFLVLRGNVIAWINAELLREGDQILWIKDTNQQLKAIYDTEKKMGNYEWNIALFGKNTTGRSLKGCKYTISTGTKPITTFPICNLLRPLNTNGFTKVADLKMVFGLKNVIVAENIKKFLMKIGISTKKQDGLLLDGVSRVTLKRLSRNVECELQTVGSVKTINEKQKVFNLTIDGIPAFETKVGISHNTQKPVRLYEWLLEKFAKEGDIILDTHVGSASSLIAFKTHGFRYVGFELDEVYYNDAKRRLENETAEISKENQIKGQMSLFDFKQD